MKLSSSIALLVSAIAGTQKATALDIADFIKGAMEGFCADNASNLFTSADSPDQTYTTDAAMEGFCVSYCGQNLPATFRGIDMIRPPPPNDNKFYCSCLFDMPTGPTPFPYSYTPFTQDNYYETGTGPVVGEKPDGFGRTVRCYKWENLNTGTSSPTGVYTPAPTAGPVGGNDFTFMGQGDCLDSAGEYYSDVYSPYLTFSGTDAAVNTCSGWCGQNTNSKFVGFEISRLSSDPEFQCNCLFSLPGSLPPYTYNPVADDRNSHPGSGPVAKNGGTGNRYSCYKWNGTTGNGGPSPPGSKSAKGTKSSKTSTKSTKVAKRV